MNFPSFSTSTIPFFSDQVVYSRTLKTASTPKTVIDLEPEAIQRMKASAARDLAFGGPRLAEPEFKAGLVEVCHCSSHAFPSDIRAALAFRMNVVFTKA